MTTQTMSKHGFCDRSNKRNFGKGRKNEPKVNTKKCLGSHWMEDETLVHARNYRTWNQASLFGRTAPSRKRVKGNRRRLRKNTRSSVVSAQSELKEEKKANKREIKKMKKIHATNTRQMQKRFLRTIHELWKQQAEQLRSLENSV